jgi:antitoxin PrlF
MKGSRTPTKPTVISSEDDCLYSLAENAGDDHSVALVPQHLAADIEHNPEKLKAVDAQLVSRIRSLVLGVDVDLDASLLSADD